MENKAIDSLSDWALVAPKAFFEAQQLFATFFDSSTVGLGIFDSQLRFQAVNNALAAVNGLPARAHVGKTAREVLGNFNGLELALQHVLVTGEPAFGLQLSGHMPNRAEVVHWIGNYFPIKDNLGNVRQIGAVVTEVSKQKTLEQSLDKLTNRLLEIRDECTQLLDRCISETRTISYLLHPPLLNEAGFASAARWYVDGFAQRSRIKVNLYLPPDSARLPQRVEMALFRVLQESLTNVHRHANTSAVDIHLERNIEAVAMEVKDYGRGIPPEELQRLQEPSSIGSVGLAGMRERVHELAGRLDIRSDHCGTVVSVTIPVPCTERRCIRSERKI